MLTLFKMHYRLDLVERIVLEVHALQGLGDASHCVGYQWAPTPSTAWQSSRLGSFPQRDKSSTRLWGLRREMMDFM